MYNHKVHLSNSRCEVILQQPDINVHIIGILQKPKSIYYLNHASCRILGQLFVCESTCLSNLDSSIYFFNLYSFSIICISLCVL